MPIPTLAEYLAKHVTDSRAEGFAAFEDATEHVLATADPADRREATALRWLKLLMVCLVEGLRAEDARGNHAVSEAVLPRILGSATFTALAVQLGEDDSAAKLARHLVDGFREGVKLSQSIRAVSRRQSSP